MDSFVVKCNDVSSIIKNQTELHLKNKEEPPVKKIRHEVVENDVEIIENGEIKATDETLNDSKYNDENAGMDTENSETQSEGSPDSKKGDKDEGENNEEDGDNDKASPPKQKRRKLSIEEKEERLKAKEEARLLKEKRLQEKQKKEQEREELKQKREQERIEKEKEKQAKKEQMEKERLEREKEKQMKKEKLEKERIEKQKKKEELNLAKEEERKKREEEKKQKEDERKQKEEEKRKKDEERKLKEEEEQRKKDKAKMSFKNFFIIKSPPKKVATVGEKCELFAPFEVKPNMTMAPILRRKPIENEETFSEKVETQDTKELYFSELKTKNAETIIRYRSGRSLRHQENASQTDDMLEDNEVVVLDGQSSPARKQECKNVMPVKLLQFSENYRPPYYGTWRKRSKKITPKNPFKKDEDLLNYEIDSDEEWEEEEPGESLSGPENEDEEEEDDDNDEENDGFFVPHGYLSDDEGVNGSDGEKEEEHVDIRDKKLDKTEGFPFEGKGKVKQLRATCFGSAWFNSPDDVPDFLAIYKINPMINLPIDIFTIKNGAEKKNSPQRQENGHQITTPRSGNNIPLKVPEEAMPLLINHVHKNSFGMNKLINKFLEIWNRERSRNGDETSSTHPKISKRQLERKILEIAKRDTVADSTKSCYLVHEHIFDKYSTALDSFHARTNSELPVNNNATVPLLNASCSEDLKNIVEKSLEKCSSVQTSSTFLSANQEELDNSPSPTQEKEKHEEELKQTLIQREIITI